MAGRTSGGRQGHSLVAEQDFSLWWLLLHRPAGSRELGGLSGCDPAPSLECAGSIAVAHELGCTREL